VHAWRQKLDRVPPRGQVGHYLMRRMGVKLAASSQNKNNVLSRSIYGVVMNRYHASAACAFACCPSAAATCLGCGK